MEENQVEIENQEVVPDSSGTITQTPGVTREDFAEFASQIGAQVAQAVTPRQEEQYIPDEEPPEFTNSLDLANFIKAQVAQGIAVERQQLQAEIAPTLIQSGIASISQGLDDVQKQCLQEAVNEVPAHLRANVLNDPMTAKLMRNAAIGAAYEKTGGKIPGSNGVSPRSSGDGLDARDQKSVNDLLESIPGLTAKDAKEMVLQARKAVNR